MVLVALVEMTLASFPLRFTDTASLNWRSSFDAARPAIEPGVACQVACLGDSLMKIGVLARVVEASTGLQTHNFAMGRAPAPATYFLLHRLLDAGIKPQTILVDFKPSMLAGSPRLFLRQWQEVLSPAEAVELAHHAGGLSFLVEIALGRFLPSVRDRWEIREAIAATLGGRIAPTYRNNRLALRNWRINGGSHLNGPNAIFDGVISPQSRRKLIIPRWECHRANAIYVDKFLALAESRGIPVVWLIAPSSPELQFLRETQGGDVAYANFIASVQRKHTSLTVVDARFAGYPTSSFADATHLNGRGSATLSHELARLLAHGESLDAHWVSLPPYRDWPIDAPAEDIERSTAIIDADLIRR